jgi:DNA-binding NtrC family response regulator
VQLLHEARPGHGDRGADGLRQHRHRRRGDQAGRLPLPRQAGQHRRHRGRVRRAEGDADVELTERQTSIKTLEWERIHETLAETGFNISETARRLGMHRRTLARKLEKQRVK